MEPVRRNWQARAARVLTPALALTLLLALHSQAKLWTFASSRPGLDYYQFWFAGPATRDLGLGEPHSRASRARLGERAEQSAARLPRGSRQRAAAVQNLQFAGGRVATTGTPLFYAVFGTLRTGNYDLDLRLFLLASLLASAGSIAILCRWLGYSPVDTLAALAVFGYWFGPIRANMEWANLNQLQLAMLAAVLALRRSGRLPGTALAGGLLGLGVAFKPTLALSASFLGLWLLIDRRPREFVAMAAGGAAGLVAGVAAGAAYFGSLAPWEVWLHQLPSLLGDDYANSPYNVSPAAILSRLVGASLSGIVLGGLTLLVAATLVVAHRRRGPVRVADPRSHLREDLLTMSMGAAVGLLGFGLAWLHYYTALIPLALYVLRPATADTRAGARLHWPRLALGITAVAMLSTDPAVSVAGEASRVLSTASAGIGALILLCAAGLEMQRITAAGGRTASAGPALAVPGVSRFGQASAG